MKRHVTTEHSLTQSESLNEFSKQVFILTLSCYHHPLILRTTATENDGRLMFDSSMQTSRFQNVKFGRNRVSRVLSFRACIKEKCWNLVHSSI